MLYNSEAFGPNGFDFNEILLRELWTNEQVTETHRAYMKRIMRKATGLYLDLEDTLYRYYKVECALQPREDLIREAEYARNFWHFVANKLVNTDDEQYEWTLVTGATRSGQIEEPLITFSRRNIANMSDFDKKLLQNGLTMAIVYKSYRELLDTAQINDRELKDGFCKEHIESYSDKEYDKIIDQSIGFIEKSIAAYDQFLGKSTKDPIDVIMDALDLEDSMMDEVETIVALYEAAREYIPTLTL